MTLGRATAGSPGRTIKQKVQSNRGAPYAARFFNTLWTYRTGQLTTSNVRRLKEVGIPLEYGSSNNNNNNGDKNAEEGDTPVKSDLQPHAMHKFRGENNWSLLIAVPKNSDHFRNIIECSRGSLMLGHTDPQLFHWFKQLGTLPPRAILSGPLELLSGDMQAEAWEQTFARHPVIHNTAQDMWSRRERKTEAEARPVHVLKPDTFALLRLRPEVKLWMNFASQTQRVWEPVIADPDPLCRCAPRFLRMLNLARQKLVPSLNMNFSLKLTNAFVFGLDKKGLWAMGTQENVEAAREKGTAREEWTELRLEFGKGQEILTEQEMEWWVRGLTKLGAPEMSQSDSSVEDATMNPEDFDYRHI